MINDVMFFGLEARVTEGVQFLDRNYPGWERKIDLSRFNIQFPSTCILGQVGREIVKEVYETGYDAIVKDHDISGQDYGFDLPLYILVGPSNERSAAWSYLGELWIDVIKTRFNTGTLSDGGN